MTTAAPVPRRPSTGLLTSSAGPFGMISDPGWYAGGFGGDVGSCSAEGGCSTCPPSGGPSSQPTTDPTGGGQNQNGTAPEPLPAPSADTSEISQIEDYGLSQASDFVGAASFGGMGGTVDASRGNLIQQYSLPAGGTLDPVVVLSYNKDFRGNTSEYPDGWTSNYNRYIDSSASPEAL